jgi:glycosyltransferase involved in cell wall biosynthesis
MSTSLTRPLICIVSHSSERSGAERSLVTAVAYLVAHHWDVLVIVPCEGPLVGDLEAVGARVKQFSYQRWTLQSTRIIESTITQAKHLVKVLADEPITVFYTNTSVVNIGALAAAIMDKPHIWHVREFPKAGCLPIEDSVRFIRDTSNHVIFNSAAVRFAFVGKEIWPHSSVVFNYVDMVPEPPAQLLASAYEARIDIIIPFYNDPTTIACIESVLRNWSESIHEVLVISDAGPDQALTEQVRGFVKSHSDRLRWLENETNQGFVVTCNRGMHASGNDVILLNSDTIVTRDWAEKLKANAYQDERIATVTPLSNYASIFSVVTDPLQAEDGNAEEINTVLELLSSETGTEVPTAHGFCMYVKRTALDALGLFDAETFGRGNGEENDFSLRARRQGWRNVASTRTYVFHRGAQSFGTEKRVLMERHSPIVHGRYPEYRSLLDDFREREPFRDIRQLLPHFAASSALQREPRLLVLGALLRHKRPLDAVRALGLLTRRSLKAQLLLAGPSGNDQEYLAELRHTASNEGITDRVHILGELRDPRPLLAMADIVLVCSENEPWGRTAVEAMRFRRPVVASRAGGVVEIVRHGETGLLYPTADVPALAEAIAQLLRDPALRRLLGNQGYRVASSNYDLEAYGRGILDVLESARDQPNPAAGMARYLCTLSQYTVLATPLPEIIRERITRPLRRHFGALLPSAKSAAHRLLRTVYKPKR